MQDQGPGSVQRLRLFERGSARRGETASAAGGKDDRRG